MPDVQVDNQGSGAPATEQKSDGGAELVQLQARMARLQEAAETAGYTTVEEYQESLEQIAYEKIVVNKSANGKGDNDSASEKPPVVPAAQQATLDTLDRVSKTSLQAFLSAQFVEYDVARRALPEAERSTVSKDELRKIIEKMPAAVEQVAQSTGGNVFAAAERLYNLSPAALADARKKGADAEKAKADAAASAAQHGGGVVITPGTQTAEDKAREDNDRRRHAIAPPTNYTMPV